MRQRTAGRHARYFELRPDGRRLAVWKAPVCESMYETDVGDADADTDDLPLTDLF